MKLKNKIEAILFLSKNPIEIKEFELFFKKTKSEIHKILKELKEEKRNTGINIKLNKETVEIITNPKYGEVLAKFFNKKEKPKKLTTAALETLAIIAYNQPVTKLTMENIRGVNVDKTLSTLEERDLIRVCGKKETIGSPNLYEVTEEFLSYMEIKAIDELPKYNEV
ncbi:MAG: SMC-Scp complex subunit ScpB [Fusobacteriia bacterium 4572_132]|nr:MAG: SMC-Scp complex subunit ScpB [Fusobacteriia bacterium 4572_132]